MSKGWKLYLSLWVVLLAWSAICTQAQTLTQTPTEAQSATPWITATATAELARYVASPAVYQMRLEVYGAGGEKLYDSDFKFGNVLDWFLQDQQGQRLADGLYRCLVTVKSFGGRTGQRQGLISLLAGEVSLREADERTLTVRNSLAAIDHTDFVTALREGVAQATTVLAHDGIDGRLVTGRGALSFRTGDYFANRDVERMRLTAEGNLGIGVDNPQARLDVAGPIRTSEGIIFPDGTIQTTAAIQSNPRREADRGEGLSRGAPGALATGKNERDGPTKKIVDQTMNLGGVGTINKIAKWISGADLGDSAISEVGGAVGIGTASPSAVLDVRSEYLLIAGAPTLPSFAVRSRPTTIPPMPYSTDFIIKDRLVGIGTENPSGAKLDVHTAATEVAGRFTIGNSTNPRAALAAVTYGSGPSIYGQNLGVGAAAGRFEIFSPNNNRPAIEAVSGTGPAGHFQGKGDPLLVLNHMGTAGNPALWFQQDGNTKAYVWWDRTQNSLNLGTPTKNPIASFTDNGLSVGKIKAGMLEITGGADFAESFDINLQKETAPASEATGLQHGLVVSIDPSAPGKLALTTQAYDRRVAGIISGAGGVKPGMVMGQEGTLAGGKYPVALSGRVYCWVDAAQGAVEPGDLLTTSSTVGHAMKVSDPAKAQGAIIGKAMTGLKEGKGLVLVLVTLQ